jgi:hypothetical protein
VLQINKEFVDWLMKNFRDEDFNVEKLNKFTVTTSLPFIASSVIVFVCGIFLYPENMTQSNLIASLLLFSGLTTYGAGLLKYHFGNLKQEEANSMNL